MASSRKTPTYYVENTYGTSGAGRKYDTLSDWEVDTDVNATAAWLITASNFGGADSPATGDSVFFVGSGASGTLIAFNTDDGGSKMQFNSTSGTPLATDTLSHGAGQWTADVDTIESTSGCGFILDCYDDAASFDDGNCTLNGATTNSSYYRLIRAASGEGHDGTPNNGFTFDYSGTGIAVIRGLDDYDSVEDIIIQRDSSQGGTRYGLYTSNVGFRVVGCILDNLVDTGAVINILYQNITGSCYLVNCLLIDGDDLHVRLNGSGQGLYAYNCTSVDCASDGFRSSNGTLVAINCLATGGSQNFDQSGTWTGSDYCAADDTNTPPSGSNHVDNATPGYEDTATNDYHLTSGSGHIDTEGFDLSGDGNYAFDDDIDDGSAMGGGAAGTTRSNWSIGFDEYVAAAGGADAPWHLYRQLRG